MKRAFRWAVVVLLVPLVVEAGLRLLPVATGPQLLPVSDLNPLLRPTSNQPFTFSVGPTLALAHRGWINNAGFASGQDYEETSLTPLIAVVGDEYVEAGMLPPEQALPGRLAAAGGSDLRAYGFAMPFAPMSQFVATVDWIRPRYRPDMLVVLVTSWDFAAGLLGPRSRPGLHYIDTTRVPARLTRIDYNPGLISRLVRRSAFASYVVFNLGLPARLARGSESAIDVAGTPAALDAGRRAIREFVRLLAEASGLPAERVVLLIDGLRPALYDDGALATAERSAAGVLRRDLISAAASAGFEVVDLQPTFREVARAQAERFEFPIDAHWTTRAHEVAATAVVATRAWRSIRVGTARARP